MIRSNIPQRGWVLAEYLVVTEEAVYYVEKIIPDRG